MTRQTRLSSHFGMIGQLLPAVNASSRIIQTSFTPPSPPVKPIRGMNEVSSLTLGAKSVRAPLADSFRAHNQHEARNRRTPSLVERWLPRADAVARARRRPTVGPSGSSGV